MNKQEKGKLYEFINRTQFLTTIEGDGICKEIYAVPAQRVQDFVKTLNDPQKVTVPKFVADWFENNKDDLTFAIYEAVAHSLKEVGYAHYPKGFMEWFSSTSNDAIEILFRMKEGYEVKKTGIYRVKLGNGYFIRFQDNGCLLSPHEIDKIMDFDSMQDAERVANTIGGIVVKVDEP
ncbi:DUF1642 domain-containing protein [Enterococcus gallinarum]|uniref:DUF1642 domain-containing protein n=1 Tax=Enterococcus gallinarum TaxID=1353 RepID=UPI001F5A7DB0|nr:DUF1642 domain-containing protein [Enterococcus gallinarum]